MNKSEGLKVNMSLSGNDTDIISVNNNLDTNNDENDNTMYVIKRDGSKEEVSFGKCQKRISNMRNIVEPKLKNVNVAELTQKVITQMGENISTKEIDELTADSAAHKETIHPDYGKLASRIIISNHHKNTSPSFSEVVQQLWDNRDKHNKHSPLVAKYFYDIVMTNKEKLNSVINYKNDFNYTYFGFKTLERAYLMKIKGKIIERPQHMLMRVAIALHRDNIREAVKTYQIMSEGYYIPATPTLFNMGTNREQGSSCFLLTMNDDSIDGIFKTITDCAKISKWAGGIGVSVHNIRSKHTEIKGTNGVSNGLVPMLRVFNETARYVDQCVIPDTTIYTTKGPIKIKDVVVGETEIYNLNGETEVVQNVLEHFYEGNMIIVNSIHSPDELKITSEHPVYCLRGQLKGISNETIISKLKNNIIRPEWIDADELTDGDMLVHSIPTYEKDIDNITLEDCYIYGLILGKGTLSMFSLYDTITLNKTTQKDILEKLTNYFNSKFVKNKVDDYGYSNEITFSWKKNVGLPFKYSDLYDNNENKNCNVRWLNLPLKKIKCILKGLINIIGHDHNDKKVIKSISRNLIDSIKFMYLRLGILVNIEKKNPSYIEELIGREVSYVLEIPKNKDNSNYINYNGLLFSRINKISDMKYSGRLYDLQMKNEHNYMLDNGLVHNGGGKRKGSFAMYLEPWHADIEEFLDLRKTTGAETERARDLFYSLWVPDLFMKRVENDEDWSLMCPYECPNLFDKYGDEFEELYIKYEKEGKQRKKIKARQLWDKIIDNQIETGTPYICYKDAINNKNNQSNLGTIRSSNLCTEIVEFTSKDEIAVCNLTSIGLPKFLEQNENDELEFNYKKLEEVVKGVSKNLNKLIDWNYYPIPETETSNRRHRPIGIGIQGLADLFALMKYPFESEEAKELNEKIFAHIYLASLENSMDTARKRKKFVQEYRKLLKTVEKNGIDLLPKEDKEKMKEMKEQHFIIGRKQLIKEYEELLDKINEINKKRVDKPSEKDEKRVVELKTYFELSEKIESVGMDSISKEDRDRMKELKEQHFIIDEELLLPSQYAGAYSSFVGSPAHEGKLQYHMWGCEAHKDLKERFNKLIEDIKKHGLRNSLNTTIMPTASTSQILGNNECIEPYTSNVYKRNTLAGEFKLINKHLLKDLIELGLWNKDMKDKIILNNGSIQNIPEIPDNIKQLYKTVWEVSKKTIIDLAADRGKYIDQTQSMNLHIPSPTVAKLSSMHFYGWKKGLKTGVYYLHTLGAAQAQQVSIDASKIKQGNNVNETQNTSVLACSLRNPDCEACSA